MVTSFDDDTVCLFDRGLKLSSFMLFKPSHFFSASFLLEGNNMHEDHKSVEPP